ncbi:LacI family DNA-binding transcriptional regulator [Brachybacterium sp. YJGR34]|uniref:LacI family DNA-binding transcriptional regulator n=1 Tax=Brachybacterium sp. YJGR34 TaxID=2059911 RepID=UPI000E0BB3F8|nr:substrate-binding domain-containing protein [Brachybacterium sp. YJGR34]
MGTIGVAIPESVWSARSEQFYTQVLHGLEDTVVPRGHGVLSHVARGVQEEVEVLHRWAERGAADIVILKDLREGDPRPLAVRELGLSCLVIGDVRQPRIGSSVSIDNAGTMRSVLEDLHRRGHERIAHVGGPVELLHSTWRRRAYEEFQREHGFPVLVAEGDYGAPSGAEATRRLLAAPVRPTVAVYDNDAMAIAGYGAAVEAGLDMPAELSILAWDDSPACQMHAPPLAVIDRQPHQLGVDLGRAALTMLADAGCEVSVAQALPRLLPRGTLISPPTGARGTAGPASVPIR